MRTHHRNSYRPAVLAVLLLLMITLQVPDLWWREFASSPSSFLAHAKIWSKTTSVAANDQSSVIPDYEPRCELRIDTPLRPANGQLTRAGGGLIATEDAVNSPANLNSVPSPFQLTSWPNEKDEFVEPPTVDDEFSDAHRTVHVASKAATKGKSNRSVEPLSRDPRLDERHNDAPGSKSLDAGQSALENLPAESEAPKQTEAPRHVNPLDIPDLNLVIPDQSFADEVTEAIEEEINPEWGLPSTVIRQLEELRRLHCNEGLAAWLDRCVVKLHELRMVKTIDDKNSAAILDELADLAQSPIALTPQTGSLSDDAQVRRAAYALQRRCEVWLAVRDVKIADAEYEQAEAHVTDIAKAAESIDRLLGSDHEHDQAWRQYLRLEEIRSIASSTLGVDAETQRNVARDALRRIESLRLTESQKAFLARPEFSALQLGLRNWAIEPFNARRFLLSVENFEAAPSSITVEELIDQTQNLQWHDSDAHRRLAECVDMHYRNANVRVAVTGTLMNQLLPVMRPIQESVSDNILGAQVSGQNQTWTQLAVELVPDANRVNIQLNATGTTESQTVSRKGPVRVFSQDKSWFRAGKPIFLNKLGVGTSSARVDANSGSQLVDVKTDYDRVPILGWIIRQLAIDQHQENRSFLRRHVKDKVSDTARTRINDEVQERIGNTKSLITEKVLTPLRDVDVEFKAIEMKTDHERVTIRARLAGKHQLSAYTARPRAMKGSVFSTQIHQSAINNVLQQMELSGQRIELEELIGRLQSRLGIARQDIHSDIPQDVQIRLADGLPLSVEFDDDRIVASIRISELITRRRAYRNFVVRAKYTADVDELNLNLTREGGIELISEAIGFRDQFALRGIFTKVMANDHRLKILRGRFEEDPRLVSLKVTQFVSHDGWLGISVGEPSGERMTLLPNEPPQQR